MAKTLTVSVTIPLPADHFEAADIMAAVKGPLATFKEALPDTAQVKTEVVTQRGKNAEVSSKRKPSVPAEG